MYASLSESPPRQRAAQPAPALEPARRIFPSAPPSIRALLGALLEPLTAVLCYLLVAASLSHGLQRHDLVLCLLVFVLGFPGRNLLGLKGMPAAMALLRSWLSLLAVLTACGWASMSLDLYDPALLLAWVLVTPLVSTAAHHLVRAGLRARARVAGNRRRAVVVGAGPLGVKVATALAAREDESTTLLGFFDDRSGDRIDAAARPQRLGTLGALAEQVRGLSVHEVYITLPLGSQARMVELLESLQGTTASLYFVPDVFGIGIIQGRLHELQGVPVVGLCETPFTGTHRLVKRACDIVLSLLILLLLAPLMLAIAVAVKLGSPGPAIFRQRRNGLDGEEIVVYKFRSMRVQEDDALLTQARRQDPRITPFGALLRRTSLDELPQFVNVLQGRMSIVGPRPHAVAHNQLYRGLIKAYMVRHKVKPGITGWAQVNGCRGETETLDKMRQRVEFDLAYLRNWSLALDLRIIARTVRLVLVDRNAY